MKKLVVWLLALTMTASLVACSGSNSTPATTEAPASNEVEEPEASQEAEPAETPEDAAPADSAPAGEFGNTTSGVPTTPTAAPEKLKVAFIMGNASMSGSSVPCAAVEKICGDFGWEIQTWDGEGDPGKENEAIMSAISWGAEVILTASVQASNVQSGLQAATEAGIACGSLSCGTDTPNNVIEAEYNYSFDIGPDYYGLGQSIGEWIAANTTGSGKVGCWDFEGEYSIALCRDGLYDKLKELNIEYEDNGCFTFDQLGDTLNRTVSTYLTNNPDTEFLFFPFDPASVPVSEYLDLNGYTDIKVIGVLGNSEMCALISQGSVASATAAYDNTYMGYAAIDQILRVLNGESLIDPHGENVPYVVIDSSNLPNNEETGWVASFDYAGEYYSLWGK
ncbi:MAG: sugar ABC transporter substrate-binding protein [Lachnospiraceae bacterium]|jgi:ribose transport system substrate-binding protein|nr:sugar ABC transporter substrate-binding protein [Lachnospiraceae bacterium]